jgi:hypothetical protein
MEILILVILALLIFLLGFTLGRLIEEINNE